MTTDENIRAALAHVPAHDRATWLRMGMAVKSELGDSGFDLWDEWSQQGASYREADARAVWRSIKPNGKITAGTLYHEAQRRGFKLNGHARPAPLSAEERERRAEEAAKREAEEAAKHEAAAALAAKVHKATLPARSDHPYLERKGVVPVVTLRELPAGELARHVGYIVKSGDERLTGRILIAPVRIGDAISTLEFIDEAGRKSALAGGAKSGGFWSAQRMPEGDGDGLTLNVAEGVATALSVHAATNAPTFAAPSCGNLAKVARALRDRYPKARIVICGDLGNGAHHAPEAAREVGGLVAFPDFGADRPERATDFNDMAQRAGAEAVRKAIEGATAPDVPEGQPDAANAVAGDSGPRVELLCAADVTPEAVRWLWDGWLAAGKLHILAGPAGTGKTTLALALAATITSGGRWPDDTGATVGSVAMWSGEDGIADTLVPRLIANGADMARVHFVRDVSSEGGRRPFDPATDTPLLALALSRLPAPPALLIVDPIVSAVAGDSHKNSETRRALQPLVDLGASIGCAILGISHFSKGTSGRDPVERVTGSLAFGALARLVMAAVEPTTADGDAGPRLFARAKSNLGPDGGGFHYALEQVHVPTKGNADAIASRVLWGARVEGKARVLLAAAETEPDADVRSMTDEAADWLRAFLDGGAMPADEATREARKLGLTDKAIRKARERLGVTSRKAGMRGGWEWALPGHAKAPEGVEDAQPTRRGALGAFGNTGAPSGRSTAGGEVF